jgi:hypothetical protein
VLFLSYTTPAVASLSTTGVQHAMMMMMMRNPTCIFQNENLVALTVTVTVTVVTFMITAYFW